MFINVAQKSYVYCLVQVLDILNYATLFIPISITPVNQIVTSAKCSRSYINIQ